MLGEVYVNNNPALLESTFRSHALNLVDIVFSKPKISIWTLSNRSRIATVGRKRKFLDLA